MTNTLRPWQLLSVIVAGMLNEQQQQIIEYLKEENRILRAQIGNRRLRLSDNDRRRLAAKGKVLGRRLLGEICCIVTRDDPPMAPKTHCSQVRRQRQSEAGPSARDGGDQTAHRSHGG